MRERRDVRGVREEGCERGVGERENQYSLQFCIIICLSWGGASRGAYLDTSILHKVQPPDIEAKE